MINNIKETIAEKSKIAGESYVKQRGVAGGRWSMVRKRGSTEYDARGFGLKKQTSK